MVEDSSMQESGRHEEPQTGCCSECRCALPQASEEQKCSSCLAGGCPPAAEQSAQLEPHSCPLCSKTFISSAHLTLHLATHKNKDRKFRCSTCGKLFHQSSHLMTHKVIHSGDRPFKCPDCGKTFGRSSHLKTHRRLHTGEKPFKCTYCDKSFTQKAGLLAHVRLHTGERPYKCEKCGEGFRTLAILLAHKAEKTSGQEKKAQAAPQATESILEDLKCGVCCRTFVRSSYIRLITRLNKGQRPYHCRVCNKTFVKLDSFVNHCEKHLMQKREKNKDKVAQSSALASSTTPAPPQASDASHCSKTASKIKAEPD